MINRRFSFFPWAADDGYVIINNDLNWYQSYFGKNITRHCSARDSLRVQKRRKHEERKGKNAKALVFWRLSDVDCKSCNIPRVQFWST